MAAVWDLLSNCTVPESNTTRACICPTANRRQLTTSKQQSVRDKAHTILMINHHPLLLFRCRPMAPKLITTVAAVHEPLAAQHSTVAT